MKDRETQPIGLIPAAGTGSRLGQLPFSKELMPIAAAGKPRSSKNVITAIENAVATFVDNDITHQHVVIAPGKWDIPAYLGDGTRFGASLAYHVASASPSVPHSLDVASPFTRERNVVLLFPDIVFRPRSALQQLLVVHSQGNADVVLALVPSDRGDKVDLVRTGEEGRVVSIAAKPGKGIGGWTWVSACWSDAFTQFMHRYLEGPEGTPVRQADREIYVADVLNAAIQDGLRVDTIRFAGGSAVDIGTPDDLVGLWAESIDR
jgi:glucose-1-phosphate thymidylyltransferase